MSEQNAVVNLTTETQRFAEVVVNGVSQGKRPINGTPSMAAFFDAVARENGIRTFTVKVDGTPLTSEAAQQPVADGARVEVSAKDARGGGAAADDDADEEVEEGELVEDEDDDEDDEDAA